ncbi:unnamed protein product [Enterobius vermicularis]|uniref:BHLH domain-containing protein n=1 Tax=Enterobius vermicularis TaxID=51028 RepID=A0A0N4VKI4_ENTVE|nr:unnamed protein product [Enterobius vermicularis]
MRPSCSSPNFSSSSSETESDSVLTVRRGRIAKIAKERRERRETMAKLQRMIPSSKDCKSQLELLQRVIDYIFILQEQLRDCDETGNTCKFENDISSLSRLFARITTECSQSSQRILSN